MFKAKMIITPEPDRLGAEFAEYIEHSLREAGLPALVEQIVELVDESIEFGSNETNQIVILHDTGVSRSHGYLVREPDGSYGVKDHSTNGIEVNGTKIPRNEIVPLQDGAVLILGFFSRMTCRYKEDEPGTTE